MIKKNTGAGNPGVSYSALYKISGAAALIAAAIFRRNLDAEFMLLRGADIFQSGPTAPPNTAIDWFRLLQNNTLLGLTLLNLFDLVNYALLGLIFLGLYGALKKSSESSVIIATVFGMIGVIISFVANQAFAMLSLSKQYAAAINETQRMILLAAGEATLAIHQTNTFAGPGIYWSFFFVTVGGLLMSMAMLRSNIFNKWAAWMGILANGFGLSYYAVALLAPTFIFVPISISAVFLLIWYILIGLWLIQLGKISSVRKISQEGH